LSGWELTQEQDKGYFDFGCKDGSLRSAWHGFVVGWEKTHVNGCAANVGHQQARH